MYSITTFLSCAFPPPPKTCPPDTGSSSNIMWLRDWFELYSCTKEPGTKPGSLPLSSAPLFLPEELFRMTEPQTAGHRAPLFSG